MRLLRPPFAWVVTLTGVLIHPALLHGQAGESLPGPFHLTLRSALAVAVMIAIGVVVGWLLGRHDQRWRLW